MPGPKACVVSQCQVRVAWEGSAVAARRVCVRVVETCLATHYGAETAIDLIDRQGWTRQRGSVH